MRIDDAARSIPVQHVGDGVHGEVAPGQVVVDVAGRDVGQRAGGRVGLAARGDHVDVASVRELDARGAEPLVGNHTSAQRPPDVTGEGDGVALHHQVEVGPMRHAEDGVAHRAPDEAGAGCPGRPLDARQDRIPFDARGYRASIGVVGDHVADNLNASAPIALDGLQQAIARWEGCTLDELQAESDRIRDDVRLWAEDPANAERPISDSPVYLDHMAVEVLIERRYFTE